MNTALLFDFSVNREDKTIQIKREFNAGLELVWQAWTTAELLDQWWAPKPYRSKTKSLDFKEGGMWLYAMISPENEALWCKADYEKIEQQKIVSWLDAFCDENGTENTLKPRSHWTNSFTEENGVTTVSVVLRHDSVEDIETMIAMGFKEGFTMCMQNLDELLLGR
ncbi:SRPBCC family protein [Niabella beijingensis]|uniref:SRPBCC family protein n=1 Tax=Niabella beijingensis TaxID=2872700 RepID=UPI001CBD8AF8|nr:SRPBCC domain-containing protein [Niabella beijingensis]MBZ4191322.1 SRPBCC domain-containing protein [Niabella beijingensis]